MWYVGLYMLISIIITIYTAAYLLHRFYTIHTLTIYHTAYSILYTQNPLTRPKAADVLHHPFLAHTPMKTTERNDTSNIQTHSYKTNTYTNRISTTSSGSGKDDREGHNYDRYELIYNNNNHSNKSNNSHHNSDNQRHNIIGHEQHSLYSDSETTLTTTSALAALSHLTGRQKYDRFRPTHASTSVIEEEAASTGSNDPPYYNNTTSATTRITINQSSPRAAVPMDISIVSPDEQHHLPSPQRKQQRATPVTNRAVPISMAPNNHSSNSAVTGHKQSQSTTPTIGNNIAKQQQLPLSNRVTPPSQTSTSSSTLPPRSSGTSNNRQQQSQRPPIIQQASPQLLSQQPFQQQKQQSAVLALPTYSTYDPILPNPTLPPHPSKNQRLSADVADPPVPARSSLLHSLSMSASSSSAYDWMARVRGLRQSMQTTRSLSLSQSNTTIPHNYDSSQHPSQPVKSTAVHHSSSGHNSDPRRNLTPSNTPLYQLQSPYTSIDGRLRPSQPTRNPQNYDPYARVLTHSSIRESVDRPKLNLNGPPDQLTRGLRSWTEDIRLLGSFSYCSDPRPPQSLRSTTITTTAPSSSSAPPSQAGIYNVGTKTYTPSAPTPSTGHSHSHTLPIPELLLVSQEGDVVVVTMLRDKRGQDRLCRLCIHYKRPHQLCIGRVTELMKTEIQYIIDTRHIHTLQTSSSPQQNQHKQKSSENQHDKLVAETQFISPIGHRHGPSTDVSFSPGSGGGEGQNYDLSLRRSLTFDRDLLTPSQPHTTKNNNNNSYTNNNSNNNVHTPYSALTVAEAASLVTQSTGVETHTTSGNSSGHHSTYSNNSNNSDNTQPYPLQTTLPKGHNSDRFTANTHEFKSTWSSHFHSLAPASSKVQGQNPFASYTILSSNLSLFNGYDPIPTTTTHTSTHNNTTTTATNSKENAWLKSYHILSLPTTLVPLYTRISKTIDVIKSRIPYIILYKFPTSTSTSSVKPPPPFSPSPIIREKNEKITSSSSSTALLYTLRNIPYKAMLMCNEPTADFCIQWLHGAKLRYCLRSGRVSLDYPSSFEGGTEGGRRGQNYDPSMSSSSSSSNHWEGMLPSSSPTSLYNTTDSSTNQQYSPPTPAVPGFIAPYIIIAQEAMSRCIREHRVIQLESIKPKHIYHIDIDDKGRGGKGDRKGQNYDHLNYNIPYVFTEKS